MKPGILMLFAVLGMILGLASGPSIAPALVASFARHTELWAMASMTALLLEIYLPD